MSGGEKVGDAIGKTARGRPLLRRKREMVPNR